MNGGIPRMVAVRRVLVDVLAAELPPERLGPIIARLVERLGPHVRPLPVPPAGLVLVNGEPVDHGDADRLTDRELAVLEAAACGLTNEHIGRRLGISADTVKTHMKRAFRRLDARDRAQAVAIAVRRGLIA